MRKNSAICWAVLGLLAACAELPEDLAQEGTEESVDTMSEALTKQLPATPDVVAENGQGFNTITQEFTARCASGPNVRINNSESFIKFDQSMTREQALEALSFSASGKGRYGLWSGSASADFARSFQSESQSVNMILSRRDTSGTDRIDSSKLTWLVKPGSANWFSACGDSVVFETKKGGKLFLLYQLNFASQSDKRAFEGSIGVGYGPFEVSANIKTVSERFKGRASVHLEAYQYGGDVSQLGRIFGSGSGGYAVANCSLDTIERCNQILKNAVAYGTGTASTDFSQNVKENPGDQAYTVREWNILNTPFPTAVVPASVETARTFLRGKFDAQMGISARCQALRGPGLALPTGFVSSTLTPIETQVSRNVSAVLAAVTKCYDALANPPTAAQVTACTSAATDAALKQAGFVAIDTTRLDKPYIAPGNAYRSDFATTATVYAGNWGSWSAYKYCPAGSYAIGYKMRVEGRQGSGDDTGLNAVELTCAPWGSTRFSYARLHQGLWGEWFSEARCSAGPISGMEMLFEGSQGSDGDDTGANDLKAMCLSGQEIHAAGGTPWGSWRGYQYCPAGTAVCGARVRVEGSQGSGDDTAMNGLELACCRY
jgi:hypothetical protein